MPPPEIPPAVLEFATRFLTSLHDLEILMLLVDTPDRWWSSETVGREVGMPADGARETLERFARQNLLDMRVTEELRYQLRPGTPSLSAGVAGLVEWYRRRPAGVIKAVTGTAPRSLRDFADAFRIRRDDAG